MAVKRKFTCPMPTLTYDGDLILTAAENQSAFATKRLDTGLLTTARAIWTSLGGTGSSAGAGSAATGTLTKEQNDAIVGMLDLFGRAKDSAKRAFPGEDVKLRGEFKVAVNTPRDLASILDRAKAVSDACKVPANATAMKAKGGWVATDTTALDTVIATVGQMDKDQLASTSVKIAGTDARNTAANEFYDNLLTIQNAANIEWPGRKEENRATRASFRLGLFPPAAKKNGKGNSNGAPNDPPPPPPAK